MTDQNLPDIPTVECEPHSVEDTGVASGDKLDQLLDTAITVREELHDRVRKIAVGLVIAAVFVALMIGAAAGVLWGLKTQSNTLTKITKENRANGQIVRDNSEAIRQATDPNSATAARGRAATTAAVNDLRRSIDCVALYVNGERPDACADVIARMDVIRGGGDPFTG